MTAKHHDKPPGTSFDRSIAGAPPNTALSDLEGENRDSVAAIKLVTWSGLVLNITLSVIKVSVGWLSNSRAVIADGIHSFSDLSTDLAILIGVKYWTKPADESHPHGHEKIESLVTAAIALMLAAAGLSIGYDALTSLETTSGHAPTWPALAAAGLSIISKELMYHWTKRVAQRTGSSALRANAWHHRSDALSSVPVLATVAAAMAAPQLAFLDKVGAVVVAVFILRTSWKLLAPELRTLSDSSAPKNVIAAIERNALSVQGVRGVHSIRTSQVGRSVSVDLHVTVDPEITVRAGHDIAEAVRSHLLGQREHPIRDVVVHLEPDEPHED